MAPSESESTSFLQLDEFIKKCLTFSFPGVSTESQVRERALITNCMKILGQLLTCDDSEFCEKLTEMVKDEVVELVDMCIFNEN